MLRKIETDFFILRGNTQTENEIHGFEQVYLKGKQTEVLHLLKAPGAKDYEQWLKDHETELPNGSVLVSGIGSYVHYGAHYAGFRLKQFTSGLSPQWKMVKEYEIQSYLPVPEKAKLWIWTGNGG